MKKATLIISLFISGAFFAQEEKTEKADTTKIKIGFTEIQIVNKGNNTSITTKESPRNTEPTDEKVEHSDTTIDLTESNDNSKKKKRKPEAHWSGLYFGMNILNDANGNHSFTNNPELNYDPAKSLNFNLNFIEKRFNIYKGYVGITSGLGINFNSFAVKNNYTLQNSEIGLTAFKDSTRIFSKNKLKATYLEVPLLLEFDTSLKKKKSVNLAVGVVGGIRIGTKLKQKYTTIEDSSTEKNVVKNDFSLNPYKLDATVRLSHRNLGIYANYSLVPMFDTNKVMKVSPMNFGISLQF